MTNDEYQTQLKSLIDSLYIAYINYNDNEIKIITDKINFLYHKHKIETNGN